MDVEGVPVGLSICYDLRFPGALPAASPIAGARVLLVPAAFTTHTGRDHWEVLLRARAIENQCYVVAAGQSGDARARAQSASGAAWSSTRGGPSSHRRRTAWGSSRLTSIWPARSDPEQVPSLANRRLV